MTIVCFEKKFIFVKSKKVAGTSVEAFLRRWTSEEDIVTPLTPRDEKWCAERGLFSRNYSDFPEAEKEYIDLCRKGHLDEAITFLKSFKKNYSIHMPANRIKMALELKGHYWEDFYSFSIDRNPYTWFLSVLLYDNDSYHKVGGGHINLQDINRRAKVLLESDGFLDLLNTKYYMHEGNLLVNYLIRYEFLGDELLRVLSPIVGVIDSSEIPHLKKNANHLVPSEIFTSDILDLIYKKCKFSFEIQGVFN